jgi:hypothetical protein
LAYIVIQWTYKKVNQYLTQVIKIWKCHENCTSYCIINNFIQSNLTSDL